MYSFTSWISLVPQFIYSAELCCPYWQLLLWWSLTRLGQSGNQQPSAWEVDTLTTKPLRRGLNHFWCWVDMISMVITVIVFLNGMCFIFTYYIFYYLTTGIFRLLFKSPTSWICIKGYIDTGMFEKNYS